MKACSAAMLLVFCVAVAAGEWKAGTGRQIITPEQPLRMGGYAERVKPSEGKLHDLWVKALALEDPAGTKLLLLTMDLPRIERPVADRITDAIRAAHKLPREAICINVSHTHTGPALSGKPRPRYDYTEKELAEIAAYTDMFVTRTISAAAAALADLKPAKLSWTNGTAGFAVNRRENVEKEVPNLLTAGKLKGPVDHDVPVLRVTSADDKIMAIACSYACHCTTLNGLQWSGDYAGYAQIELEKKHPGATAMFFTGCGADQNPLPRRSVELAEKYGLELAGAVEAALQKELQPVSENVAARFALIDLPFAKVPTQDDLNRTLQHKEENFRRWAELLTAELKQNGKLPSTYSYPVQVWQLGKELTWVQLGGEVVVDYSLRLKKELGPGTWVAGYCNDIMAYIPSLRVLKEGGYEGRLAMTWNALPSAWGDKVEEMIIAKVHELTKEVRAAVGREKE